MVRVAYYYTLQHIQLYICSAFLLSGTESTNTPKYEPIENVQLLTYTRANRTTIESYVFGRVLCVYHATVCEFVLLVVSLPVAAVLEYAFNVA